MLLLRKLLSILRVVVLVCRKIGMRSGGSGNVGGSRRRLIPSGSSGGSGRLRLNPWPSGVSTATAGWRSRSTRTTDSSHRSVQRAAPRAVGSICMTTAGHGSHVETANLCLATSGRSSAFLVRHANFYRFGSHARLSSHIGKCMLLFRFGAKSYKAVAFGEARFIKDDLV